MGKENISLYCKEAGSDKVYNASIEEVPGGYEVHFSYGRRGSALTSGKKTTSPVSLIVAEKIYNKLINEKVLKGYKSAEVDSTQTMVSVEARDSGIRVQLLNEIEADVVETLINDNNWCAQEKFDGRRRPFIKTGANIVATNRKGLTIPIGKNFHDKLSQINASTLVLDTEDMGDYAMVFDIVEFTMNYWIRYDILVNIFEHYSIGPEFRLVETAWSTEEKRALYERLKKDNAEGIVFKKTDALYVPGRPNSGGDQLKFKFCATATCFVRAINSTKRSVLLAVYGENEEDVIDVGNCTVYPNMAIPEIGDLVEIKYLYAYKGGSLFQPILIGTRDDLDIDDCKLSQLKYKREE